MKLIIKQYLASLRERDELDAVLPDILSQMGLNVYSLPGKGTRQDGVDVAAVGSIDGNSEKVYLFSIKAGDLTRNFWDGDALQSLRPSLNEILDAYIPNRLPNEHKDKEIVICLCFGGDIKEQVRIQVEGYIKKNTSEKVSFEEWNGDKLAALILSNFMQEDLLPKHARSQLRKSLALLDEPEASYQHFAKLIRLFSTENLSKDKEVLTALRQINICLWILYVWAREEGNTESSFLSSELSLLHAWEISKSYSSKTTKSAKAVQSVFSSILSTYLLISSEYLSDNILPNTSKLHGLSVAVQPSTHLDVNLKLFDVLGRLAMGGLLTYWCLNRVEKNDDETRQELKSEVSRFSNAIKQLILNNPVLFLPIKDDQAIDISIAVMLLMTDANNHNDIKLWLSELVNRASFSYQIHGQYPCNLDSYSELLEHPQQNNENYRQEITNGSILFPMIAFWAGLLSDNKLYTQVQTVKEKHLAHCNFQFCYPDESSEEHLYINSDMHGATLSNACINQPMDAFLKQVFGECEKTPHFKTLSAVENGLWPIILIACRHYRFPAPINLWEGWSL